MSGHTHNGVRVLSLEAAMREPEDLGALDAASLFESSPRPSAKNLGVRIQSGANRQDLHGSVPLLDDMDYHGTRQS